MSWLWLGLGTLASLFAGGRFTLALAAWLAPVFLLRFMRVRPRAWVAWLALAAATAAAAAFAWRGVIPAPVYPPTVIGVGLLGSLPYLLDRWLARGQPGFASTLVFPSAVTALELLTVGTSPLGSFGAQAYSQYAHLSLLQLVSVTGLSGLTFLVAWFASLVNWAWERRLVWAEVRSGAAVYGGVLLAVWLAGAARLTFAPDPQATVRVASLTAGEVNMASLMRLLEADRQAFRRQTAGLRRAYFEGTLREARAGARLIVWPELAGVGLDEDEDELIVRGRALASTEQVYLAMALATIYADPERPYENKLIVIDPNGEIVLEHRKFGGAAIEGFAPGDRVLRTVDTPFGRLSGAVCWDMDFPAVIRQAGRNGTDILLAPSYEWREIDPLHAQMAVFRAVENGVSLVHPSDGGRSLATDPYGRVLAETDHHAGGERVMIAQVPTRGVTTLYPWLGDWPAWASLAWVVVLLARVALSRAASRRAASR